MRVKSLVIASSVGMADVLTLLGLSFPPEHPLRDLWRLTLAQVAPLLPHLLLVLTLLLRPAGLAGNRED